MSLKPELDIRQANFFGEAVGEFLQFYGEYIKNKHGGSYVLYRRNCTGLDNCFFEDRDEMLSALAREEFGKVFCVRIPKKKQLSPVPKLMARYVHDYNEALGRRQEVVNV